MKRVLLVVFCLLISGKYFGQDVPQSERNALIKFYDNLNGDNWIIKNNWRTTKPVSDWYGIRVSTFSDGPHVTGITFGSQNNLIGEIPSEISYLTKLDELWLTRTAISKIPDEIGTLANLQSITLSGSYEANGWRPLTAIPQTIGNLSNLIILDLSQNSLTELPNTLQKLTKLKTLSIAANQFTSFPTVITKLKSLAEFHSFENKMNEGTVLPATFKNLTSLSSLYLDENNMSIDDPAFFANMPNLSYLYLGNTITPNNLDLSVNKQLSSLNIKNGTLKTINLRNGANAKLISAVIGSQPGTIKCMAVDNPIDANNAASPYSNYSVYFINGTKNYQSDCSSYLSTNEIKISGLKIISPVKDIFIIQNTEKISKVEIYSLAGQLVKSFKTAGGNVSDLVKGIYLVKITTDKGVTTQKIIKE